jgi:hypothetical protein
VSDDWEDRAACRTDAAPDDWFRNDRKPTLSRGNVRALNVCRNTCPVLELCRRRYVAMPDRLRYSVIAGGLAWDSRGRADGRVPA